MGGFWSKDDLSADFVQELMDETGFNQKQIHRLYIRFRHLDKDKKGYLTKEDLLRLPQVNIIIFYKKLAQLFTSLMMVNLNQYMFESFFQLLTNDFLEYLIYLLLFSYGFMYQSIC